MATNQSTSGEQERRPPTGVQGINHPNKARATVLGDWENVRDGLPAPRDVWRWGETPMQHKTLYNLKEMELITRAGTEKYWRTTRTLWEYVNETALTGEDVGATVRWDPEGQRARDPIEPLTSPSDASQETLVGWVESRACGWDVEGVSTRSSGDAFTKPAGAVY